MPGFVRFCRGTRLLYYLYSLWYWICTVSTLLLKVPALVPASFLGGFVVLSDKECLFYALQAHYLKVGRVLANNGFLTSGGDSVISGHCCMFVRGMVVWFGLRVVKYNSSSIWLIKKRE